MNTAMIEAKKRLGRCDCPNKPLLIQKRARMVDTTVSRSASNRLSESVYRILTDTPLKKQRTRWAIACGECQTIISWHELRREAREYKSFLVGVAAA